MSDNRKYTQPTILRFTARQKSLIDYAAYRIQEQSRESFIRQAVMVRVAQTLGITLPELESFEIPEEEK